MTSLDTVTLLSGVALSAGLGPMAMRFYTIMNCLQVVQVVVITWHQMIYCISVFAIA
jgi:hypothetical protein